MSGNPLLWTIVTCFGLAAGCAGAEVPTTGSGTDDANGDGKGNGITGGVGGGLGGSRAGSSSAGAGGASRGSSAGSGGSERGAVAAGGSGATRSDRATGGDQAAGDDGRATGAGGASTSGSAGGRQSVGGRQEGAGAGGRDSGSGGRGGGAARDAGAGAGGSNNGTSDGGSGRGGRSGQSGSGGASSAGSGAGGKVGNAGGNAAGAGGSAGAASECSPPPAGSKGTNPLFTDQYTADPGVLVHDCTFYIHCGHDEGSTGFVMKEWFVLSSTDMVHWEKKVGTTLKTFSWAKANAWAGQVVKKNDKFYWFVPVAEGNNGAMAIGVAVSDSPTGPFTDAIGKPLVNDAFEISNMGFSTPEQTPFTIDPTVFVDDDGQAYLHYGGFSRMVQAKLNSDMISINGKMQESTPQGYFEAPYLIKRNGVYYEIYAAGSNPATIDYATSSSPMGPWSRRGRILDALPKSSSDTDWPTNHAAVAEFAGQWYITYHLSNGPNGGGTYKREVAVDKLTFNADGTIGKVTPSSGLTF